VWLWLRNSFITICFTAPASAGLDHHRSQNTGPALTTEVGAKSHYQQHSNFSSAQDATLRHFSPLRLNISDAFQDHASPGANLSLSHFQLYIRPLTVRSIIYRASRLAHCSEICLGSQHSHPILKFGNNIPSPGSRQTIAVKRAHAHE
jgi:hypothetical protein